MYPYYLLETLQLFNFGHDIQTCIVFYDNVTSCVLNNGHVSAVLTGADLGKMLTDLLQNERRRRKLLGVPVACSPGNFFPGFLSQSDNMFASSILLG